MPCHAIPHETLDVGVPAKGVPQWLPGENPPRMRWPWLRALRVVHDGTVVAGCHGTAAAAAAATAAALITFAVFPGRENLPYSLGSVLGAIVARFLPQRLVLAYCATLDVPRLAQVSSFTVDGAGAVHLSGVDGVETRRHEEWAVPATTTSSSDVFSALTTRTFGDLTVKTSAPCSRVTVWKNERCVREYMPACLVSQVNGAIYVANAQLGGVTLFHLSGRARQSLRCDTGSDPVRHVAFCELTKEMVIGHSRGVTALHIPSGTARMLTSFWRVRGVAVHQDTLYVADDALCVGFIRHICVYR